MLEYTNLTMSRPLRSTSHYRSFITTTSRSACEAASVLNASVSAYGALPLARPLPSRTPGRYLLFRQEPTGLTPLHAGHRLAVTGHPPTHPGTVWSRFQCQLIFDSSTAMRSSSRSPTHDLRLFLIAHRLANRGTPRGGTTFITYTHRFNGAQRHPHHRRHPAPAARHPRPRPAEPRHRRPCDVSVGQDRALSCGFHCQEVAGPRRLRAHPSCVKGASRRFAMAFGHPLTREPLRALMAGRKAGQRPARGTVNLRSCGRSANHISLIRHTRPGESRRRTGENRPRIAQVDSAPGPSPTCRSIATL